MFFTKKDMFKDGLENKATDDDYIKAMQLIFYMIWGFNIVLVALFAYLTVCSVLAIGIGIWSCPLLFVLIAAIIISYVRASGRLELNVSRRK